MHPTNVALTKIEAVIKSLRNPTAEGYVVSPGGSYSVPMYPHIQTRDEIKNPVAATADPNELRERAMLRRGEVPPKDEPAYAEVEEDLIGAAFVVAQAHLARESKLPKLKKGNSIDTNDRKQRINLVANYFKHHPDWGMQNNKWVAKTKGGPAEATIAALALIPVCCPETRLLTKLASWALTNTFDGQLLNKKPRWMFDGDVLWHALV
jgi:hypothetical protein